MIYTNLMHRQRSRRGTKIPHNGVIDALLVKVTETELVIQDLETAIDGDGNGAGQFSAPQHKQSRKHLLNRQRKIISQRQQLHKLQSVLRSGKCGLRARDLLSLSSRAQTSVLSFTVSMSLSRLLTRKRGIYICVLGNSARNTFVEPDIG